MLDILIRNGWVADGTGNPAYPADVAIEGDRIVEVGSLPGAQAARVIDAAGKIVCPGFVDAHSHSDWSIHTNKWAHSSVRQGITTEMVGNCGYSSAPVTKGSRDMVAGKLANFGFTAPIPWSTFREYLDTISKGGCATNHVWFVGHNTLRAAAGVTGAKASEEQLREMEAFTREAMEAGCEGMTTGLEFEPGRPAPTEEIIRIARVVGEYRGYYGSHIRNRDTAYQQAVEEFLRIVRESGTIGELSHMNIRHNTAPEGTWERAVETLTAARAGGLNVMADTTPFIDGTGQMSGILPPWLMNEGPARTAERLRDPAIRARARTDCDRYWRFIHRGDWHRVRMLSSPLYPELAGKNFREIAALWRKDEWDCYFDILAAHGERILDVIVVGQLFTPEHSEAMIRQPLFSLAVDGFSVIVGDPKFPDPSSHPINYAGMIHYLTYHVRERHSLRLEEAIRKMSSMPAIHHGLKRRGLLLPGYFADVVVFDFDALEDVSTIENPKVYCRGVEHVLVNGVPVLSDGQHTGALPGRHLSYQ
jgi:N-acyl-D-amino-acid deacylase